jgi:hypothetical protein
MKKFIGAVSFKFGGKVREFGQRRVMRAMPHIWVVRVRMYCRDPETQRAYRIMRDLRPDKPIRLLELYPIIHMVARELSEQAQGQHYSGGWFALAIPRGKKKRQPRAI